MILDHLVEILAQDPPSSVIASSENVYTPLITRLSKTQVRQLLVGSLDVDVQRLYNTGLLDLQAFQRLDHSKPSNYQHPGVYLHVIYDLAVANLYWLYVGAAIDVKARIKQHYKFRHTTSRICLHHHIWNTSGHVSEDFFILLGGFKELNLDEARLPPLLNLIQHWNCLNLQTLPSSILSKYLPYGILICDPNTHLNRASALRQKNSVKGALTSGSLETAQELEEGAEGLAQLLDLIIKQYFEARNHYYSLLL